MTTKPRGPAALIIALGALVACEGEKTPVPPSPTPTQAQVAVSVQPAPLVATPRPGSSNRYSISANLTFREVAGVAATVTQLRVTVSLSSGETASIAEAVNLAVPALGTTPYTLETVLDLPGTSTTGKWRLETSGSCASSMPLMCAPVEADLTIARRLPDAVLVGAGDIARCNDPRPEATARLLDALPGTVFTSGDNVYPYGSTDIYNGCYGPTWGRHLSRTYATPGNHDWEKEGTFYFAYFGQAAGPAGTGYYTFSLGAWDVIALNTNLPVAAGSAQYEWLRSVLAASGKSCTVAIFHHPLFSSSLNGNASFVRDAWRLLYEAGAEIVVNGHDHTYERFAPQDPNGAPDANGIREFVVGTGGDSLYDRKRHQPNSEVFDNRTHGVLKLTLKDGSYQWEFVPIAGQTFRDFGSGECVAARR